MRWAARAGAALLGLGLAWVLVPNGLSALAISRNDPALAVQLRPSAGALAAAGDLALKEKRFSDADALGRASLNRSLFNVVAFRVIGLARESRNADDDSAAGFMALAGQLGWRDTLTQLWYVDTASRLGEYQIAVQRADALLRRSEFTDQTLGYLRRAAVDQKARPFILERLVENPGWRKMMFRSGKTMPEDEKQGLEALIVALRRSRTPVTREEIAPYLDALIRIGDTARADRVRHAALGGSGDDGWPRDPDFRQAAALRSASAMALPFDWAISAPAGVDTQLAASGGLTLDIASRWRGVVAEQLIRLAPGAYRLQATLEGSKPNAGNLLSWTIACEPSHVESDILPTRVASSDAETTMTVDFSISASDCAYQRLKLGVGSSLVSGNNVITVKRVAIKPR